MPLVQNPAVITEGVVTFSVHYFGGRVWMLKLPLVPEGFRKNKPGFWVIRTLLETSRNPLGGRAGL